MFVGFVGTGPALSQWYQLGVGGRGRDHMVVGFSIGAYHH